MDTTTVHVNRSDEAVRHWVRHFLSDYDYVVLEYVLDFPEIAGYRRVTLNNLATRVHMSVQKLQRGIGALLKEGILCQCSGDGVYRCSTIEATHNMCARLHKMQRASECSTSLDSVQCRCPPGSSVLVPDESTSSAGVAFVCLICEESIVVARAEPRIVDVFDTDIGRIVRAALGQCADPKNFAVRTIYTPRTHLDGSTLEEQQQSDDSDVWEDDDSDVWEDERDSRLIKVAGEDVPVFSVTEEHQRRMTQTEYEVFCEIFES